MAVAGSGVIPRKATLEARYSPRIAAAVANPLAGRGTQYRSRRTTPRSSHRTPAPGPIASGDAPNRTRAGCCFVVERASCGAPTDRSPDTQVRLATPAGAAIATGDAVVRAGGSARLHPWQRHSDPGPAARAEAVVAPPGTNRPGCARSRQGTEFAESRFRASRVTFMRRQRPYRRSLRSRSSGCCSARAKRSSHRCRDKRCSVSSIPQARRWLRGVPALLAEQKNRG